MTAPPKGFERFKEFLAADITAQQVEDATADRRTIWGQTIAGHAFERSQGADIRDCYPGSFPIIDSYEEYERKGKTQWAVVSLKVIYCDPDAEVNPALGALIHKKVWAHVQSLGQFYGGSSNLQPKDGSEKKQIAIDWDDFDIAVLRVGIPKSLYDAQTQWFMDLASDYTDIKLGGKGDLKIRRGSGGQRSIKTEVVAFPDANFGILAGNLYEVVKDANIHGHRPGTFKGIDKLVAGKGRVISYKSLDLNAVSYEKGNPNGLNAVKGTMRKYIGDLKAFKNHSMNIADTTIRVKASDFTEKRLSVAIPMLSVSDLDHYRTTFKDLVEEAKAAHITLRVHRVA